MVVKGKYLLWSGLRTGLHLWNLEINQLVGFFPPPTATFSTIYLLENEVVGIADGKIHEYDLLIHDSLVNKP